MDNHSKMNDDAMEDEPLITHESVHELRQRVRYMREAVDEERNKAPVKTSNSPALSDGEKFLSFIFAFILFVIIAVGIYAFRNLYLAIMKKFYKQE